MSPLIVGFAAMALGIGLMFWHWSQWKALARTARTRRDVRYGANQFRRRVMIGSLMAIVGSLVMSLGWASDYRVFTATVLLLLVLLAGILVLGLLDLIHVIVHLRLGPPSREARQRLIHDYLQQRRNRDEGDSPSDA